MNAQADSSEVNLFRYSPALIIATVHPNLFPSEKYVCVVLIEAPILDNSFLVFYINT